MPSERVQRQIDSLLDQAEAAIATGEWLVVQERAQGALAFDPANEDAQAFLQAAKQAGSIADYVFVKPLGGVTPSQVRSGALTPSTTVS